MILLDILCCVTSGDVADLSKDTLRTTSYEEFYCLLQYLCARNSNRKIQQYDSVGGGVYDMFDEIGFLLLELPCLG
jgi:hypothetical protein